MRKHITILAGGLSEEREISLSGAVSIEKTIQDLNYKTSILDPKAGLIERIRELKPDIIFNSLHGTYGEDGAIQGVFEIMQIPYTHSNVSASSAAFNKDITKYVADANGIKTPKFEVLKYSEYAQYNKKNQKIGYPHIVKPIAQGSTIGLFKIDEKTEIKDWHYGDHLMVEEYISGIELSVFVFKDKACGVIEVEYKGEIFSYNTKYSAKDNSYFVPARITEEIYAKAMSASEKIHKILGCRSISRVDFRFDKSKNELFFLEINTHPRITEGSLVYKIAKYHDISLKDIVKTLIEDARCDLK